MLCTDELVQEAIEAHKNGEVKVVEVSAAYNPDYAIFLEKHYIFEHYPVLFTKKKSNNEMLYHE